MERLDKVLALGAHPDDLELGCGATLAKLVQQGVQVRAIVLSAGVRGHDGGFNRPDETRNALGLLGITDVVQYDFPDTEMESVLTDVIRAIESQVIEFRPDRVYTMFDEDRHQDHRTVYRASMVACRSVNQILGYETPSSYPNFKPTAWERVSDEQMALKVQAIKSHASQEHRIYMQEKQVTAAATFRGYQNGLDVACEGVYGNDEFMPTGSGAFDPRTVGTKPFGFHCAVEKVGHRSFYQHRGPQPGDRGYDLMC